MVGHVSITFANQHQTVGTAEADENAAGSEVFSHNPKHLTILNSNQIMALDEDQEIIKVIKMVLRRIWRSLSSLTSCITKVSRLCPLGGMDVCTVQHFIAIHPVVVEIL